MRFKFMLSDVQVKNEVKVDKFEIDYDVSLEEVTVMAENYPKLVEAMVMVLKQIQEQS